MKGIFQYFYVVGEVHNPIDNQKNTTHTKKQTDKPSIHHIIESYHIIEALNENYE